MLVPRLCVIFSAAAFYASVLVRYLSSHWYNTARNVDGVSKIAACLKTAICKEKKINAKVLLTRTLYASSWSFLKGRLAPVLPCGAV